MDWVCYDMNDEVLYRADLADEAILGIDPGLAALGVALLGRRHGAQRWRALYVASFRTAKRVLEMPTVFNSKSARKRLNREVGPNERLERLVHEVVRILDGKDQDWPWPVPSIVSIENQANVGEGRRKQKKTSAAALYVREVAGAMKALTLERRIPLIEVEPQDLKQCVGATAHGSKDDVIRGVRLMVDSLGDSPYALSEHSADACAAAIAGARIAALSALGR